MQPTGLALDRATDNLYLSGVDGYNPESVIKVILTEELNKSVDLVTSHQTVITDVVIECGRGLLFWSERLMPRTGRIICSTMDGSLMKWKLKNTVHPMALALVCVTNNLLALEQGIAQGYDGSDNGRQQDRVKRLSDKSRGAAD